ncbi:MAG: hypothetical protein Kow00124_31950 [Anaerolineae bacterium]
MNRKKLAALAAILVIALAVIGVGYGLWFEDLYIDGTVTTGELDVKFDGFKKMEWFGLLYEDGSTDFASRWHNRELFEIKYDDNLDCWVSKYGPDEALDNPDNSYDNGADRMVINVRGAYPSYHCMVKFAVQNIGTVPVHLTPPEASPNNPELVYEMAGCFRNGLILPEHPADYDWTWYEGEGCDANDLEVVSGIAAVDGRFVATVKNNSETCSYLVGLADYEKYDTGALGGNPFDTQWLYDYESMWLGPGEEHTFSIGDPGCTAQVDLFRGPVLWTLIEGDYPMHWYGNRKLDYQHFDGRDFCDPKWQLHPGEKTWCAIMVHFTNDTPGITEDAEYTFEYLIRAYQWNEDDAMEGWDPYDTDS